MFTPFLLALVLFYIKKDEDLVIYITKTNFSMKRIICYYQIILIVHSIYEEVNDNVS